jgi:hypothetical protein
MPAEAERMGGHGPLLGVMDTTILVGKNVVPAEISSQVSADGPKLSKNQQTMLSILNAAGAGLTTEQWNEQARKVDIGTKREADLYDIRVGLKSKGITRQYGEHGTSPDGRGQRESPATFGVAGQGL